MINRTLSGIWFSRLIAPVLALAALSTPSHTAQAGVQAYTETNAYIHSPNQTNPNEYFLSARDFKYGTNPGASSSSIAESGTWGSLSSNGYANLATGVLKSQTTLDNIGASDLYVQSNAYFGDGFRTSNPDGSPYTWGPSSSGVFTLNLSGSIAAGGYFLVRLQSPQATGTALPTPDVSGTNINISQSAGKLALVSNQVATGPGARTRFHRGLGTPGAAVVVVKGDEVLFAEGYGRQRLGGKKRVTKDTVFPIASCSKTGGRCQSAIRKRTLILKQFVSLANLVPWVKGIRHDRYAAVERRPNTAHRR